tara:strand:+ start:757 stop:930 length:174 start_codon:yes stop_codon:yes gene_type:complete
MVWFHGHFVIFNPDNYAIITNARATFHGNHFNLKQFLKEVKKDDKTLDDKESNCGYV